MARATRHRSGNGFGVTRILCRPSFANGGWHGGWHHRGGSWDSDPPLVSASDLAYSGRDSHSSLLQLPLLLQLPVSLWVFVPVWVCARARLWLWLRPLLDQMSGSPFLLSQDPHTPYSGRSCDNRFSGTISLTDGEQERALRRMRDHAAATASRHWSAASARNIRSVDRGVRWR